MLQKKIIPYLSISLIIRHNLNIHPAHSPALFVCLSSKQAGDKQAASCWLDLEGWLNLYEMKNCLLLSLSHAGYKPKKADSFWASFTGSPHSRIVTMQAGNCLMIRPAVLLPTPWQPGPHQLLTKHTSAPGHPWSIEIGPVLTEINWMLETSENQNWKLNFEFMSVL